MVGTTGIGSLMGSTLANLIAISRIDGQPLHDRVGAEVVELEQHVVAVRGPRRGLP
jgi:hypothetical protein